MKQVSIFAVKVGRVCAELSNGVAFASMSMMTVLLSTLCWSAWNRDDNDSEIFIGIMVAFWGIIAVAYVLTRTLIRERTINGDAYSPEQYALVSDELRRRGIHDARRFIQENPEYARHAKELGQVMAISERNARRLTPRQQEEYKMRAQEMESLVYAVDGDPVLAKDTLIVIMAERKIINAKEARILLKDIMNAETSLMSGVL